MQTELLIYILSDFFGEKVKGKYNFSYILHKKDYLEIHYNDGYADGVFLISYVRYNKLRNEYLLNKIKHIKEKING